jgi:nucleotide-binding universal stress UspA family protein
VSGSYSTVMVGTDGSATSFRAVDRAAAIARDAEATLVLLTAFRPMSHREEQDARQQLGEDAYKVAGSSPAEGVLPDASDRARSVGATKIETAAVEGDPVDALVEEAIKRKVDLLVVGNRGLGGFKSLLLGSVSQQVVHHATCPVVVVHHSDTTS